MKKWITILGIVIAILAVLVSSSLAGDIDFSYVIVKLGEAGQPAVLTIVELPGMEYVMLR
ncbi:MAG: hypothetical protein RIC80_18305 [Cyclobacteriaceae bacterium]